MVLSNEPDEVIYELKSWPINGDWKTMYLFLYWVSEVHIHPEFTIKDNANFGANDLALLKLKVPIEQIPFNTNRGKPSVLRSICLPERNVFNKRREFAIQSSFGGIDRKISEGLKIGYKMIYPSDDYSSSIEVNFLHFTSPENSSYLCQVDRAILSFSIKFVLFRGTPEALSGNIITGRLS